MNHRFNYDFDNFWTALNILQIKKGFNFKCTVTSYFKY